MATSQITDHVERSLAANLSQFRGKPAWTGLITSIVRQVQEVEDAAWAVLVARVLANATGWTLDKIGKLVGQERQGMVDDDYRRYISARIATNRSKGGIRDLITISRLILNDDDAVVRAIWQTPTAHHTPATVVVRIEEISVATSLADILIDFLRQAVLGGVRVILEYTSETWGSTFRWDAPSRGWDSGATFLDAKD